jgi:large subunit ribosomal protein L29
MPTATELRELDDDELETRLVEYRREMLNLRFQLATGQLDNYARLNVAKRNVARVLTVLRDREIALAEGRDAGPVFLEQPVRPPRHLPEITDDDAVYEDVADDDGSDDDIDEVVDAEMDEPDDDDVEAAEGDDEEDES